MSLAATGIWDGPEGDPALNDWARYRKTFGETCSRAREHVERPGVVKGQGKSMPTFHFQVRTETHVLLTEAADLPDMEKARVEASCRIGELLKQHAGRLWVDEDWRLDVTDDVGLILFTIQISARRAASTSEHNRG